MRKTVSMLIALLLIACMFTGMFSVSAATEAFQTYTYSSNAKFQYSPNAYAPVEMISQFGDEILMEPLQIRVDDDNNDIYIANTGNNNILVLDNKFQIKKVIDFFVDKDGMDQYFSSPEGVYLDKEFLYICDTQNERIVILNKKDYSFSAYINAPDPKTMPEDFRFAPSRMAIDMTDRFNIISKNNEKGIICMDRTGSFEGFVGAIKVAPTASEIFWRTFMTPEQLIRTEKLIPSPYSCVNADENGFIYATTSSYTDWTVYNLIRSKSKSGDRSPIKKFAPSGDDVLKRNGYYQPVGDLNFIPGTMDTMVGESTIDDVAIADNGIYILADSKYGKIFAYETDGNLLYAFGGSGSTLGNFEQLVSVDFFGENDEFILALDNMANRITVFSRTDYGSLINTAINRINADDSEGTIEAWKQIKAVNSNFDLAYVGIGKSLLKSKEYKEAMEYFYSADMKEYYSTAFKYARAESVKKFAILIPIVIIGLLLLIAYLMKKANKYNKEQMVRSGKRTLKDQLIFSLRVVFHPFDGFWDLKNEKRGGPLAGTIILSIVAVSYVISDVTTGYLFRSSEDVNIMMSLLSVFIPVFLWTVGSWCLTSLTDGKGRLVEIYTATCYAAVPLAFVIVPIAILSNVLTLEEQMIISTMMNIAIFWVAFLIFGSTLSTHSYTAGKAVIVCLLTIVVMGFIIFLFLLFFNVTNRFITFIQEIYNEISFRT